MAFWGDYHTHTVYSHGKGSIEDSVLKAAKLGLRELAITEHGFNHLCYNLRRGELAKMREQAEMLAEKYPQVKLYIGVEANILSPNGKIDVREADKPKLDLTVCGYHKLVRAFPASLQYFLPNNIGLSGAKTIARNTAAYLSALEKNEIDILSHPGNSCKCDVREVARACKYFGTYFELNGKRIALSDEELAAAAEEGCEFIASSDAHEPRRVGDFSLPVKRIEKLGIPLSRLANYERLPLFRSGKCKDTKEGENVTGEEF